MKNLKNYIECEVATPGNTLGAGNPSVEGDLMTEPIQDPLDKRPKAKKQKLKNGMKNISDFIKESIIEEGVIDKYKALTKTAYEKILRKINNLENPCIMVDLGLHDMYRFTWNQSELKNVEYAVFDIKTVIDKLNKNILDNVKSAKEISLSEADDDMHLYELVGYTTDDAIKLYNTVSDMFVKEMKKIGVEKIKDKDDIRGSGLRKFNHLETDAEFKMERTLDNEHDRRPDHIYIYPSVRLEYI